ncbi:MAG: HAD-IIA family hydrolase [Actinomycetaceae bacterium]|nr:HAD-IIA family hydrolase [Actinomycetaceae bacterium]
MNDALSKRYDVGLFDLDGVCYLGNDSIDHAVDETLRAVGEGMDYVYVTNNASRPREDVATHLRELGFPAEAERVLTSAEVGADMARRMVGDGARVLIIGGKGLKNAAAAAGLVAVSSADDAPDVVLQGFFPECSWTDLSEAALAIRAGAIHIATNLDRTIPRERGLMVGNGSLVGAVANSTGVTPFSAGKPEPEIFRTAASMLGSKAPLAIGDNLDTDIQGAVAAGIDSLHVLTGLASARDICLARQETRPTYLCDDLRGLNEPYPATQVEGDWVCVGSARARWDGGRFEVNDGQHGLDVAAGATLTLDAYRCLAQAAWTAADAGADIAPAIGEISAVRS